MRLTVKFLTWFGLPGGLLLVALSLAVWSGVLRGVVMGVGIILLVFGLLLDTWYLRPNHARVDPSIVRETWDLVKDGWHNSNTDLIYWKEHFYLIHAASPYHFANQKCHLVLHRSHDAHLWEKIAEFNAPGEDIRDPKFAPIGGQLFLYALVNRSFDPEPYTTVYASSQEGEHWSPFQHIQPEGWLFWRPKSRDGNIWYVPAYWWEHGKSVLFSSSDGVNWKIRSTIYTGDRNDETDIEFLPDGRLIATARLEFSFNIFGDRRGSTLITLSEPPYESWQESCKSQVTRLDGPYLFAYNGRVYAAGRYQPELGAPLVQQGSVFSRKRTSLFEVRKEGLVYLTDLPSAGDTSYTGVVLQDNHAYICYYTSEVKKDYPWIIGMLEPSCVQMVIVDLNRLEALAKETPAK
jgi:hypothetical protein